MHLSRVKISQFHESLVPNILLKYSFMAKTMICIVLQVSNIVINNYIPNGPVKDTPTNHTGVSR